ncbi:hypothetical protein QL996_03000 [Planococcus sp. APC 4015]|nr:hypothetical protein [Planococcus sp. APC 4015]
MSCLRFPVQQRGQLALRSPFREVLQRLAAGHHQDDDHARDDLSDRYRRTDRDDGEDVDAELLPAQESHHPQSGDRSDHERVPAEHPARSGFIAGQPDHAARDSEREGEEHDGMSLQHTASNGVRIVTIASPVTIPLRMPVRERRA